MSAKHHKAALAFLWEFWKLACISIGSVAGVLVGGMALILAIEAMPIPLRIVAGVVIGVGPLYWVGYSLSKDQAEHEERMAAFKEELRDVDPKDLF